jgi:hypothetical protein
MTQLGLGSSGNDVCIEGAGYANTWTKLKGDIEGKFDAKSKLGRTLCKGIVSDKMMVC